MEKSPFKIRIATLFPETCGLFINESILKRGISKNAIDIKLVNIRDYSDNVHRHVDDSPYGGGMGMVMSAEPIFKCFEAVCEELKEKPYVIYMSPKGKLFDQKLAFSLKEKNAILIICGHYEGVDERVLEEIADEEISIGDFVLTGGELPALVLVDAVARLCDGVLASPECYEDESFTDGLLEYPQYTRPEIWHGRAVPGILLSGHHKNIKAYRLDQSLEITKKRRPDLHKKYIKEKNKER